jgi:magnesium chelatase subunit ChlD-like protein
VKSTNPTSLKPPLDRHEVLQEKINDALVLALGLESGATGIYRAPSDASLEEMIENMQVPGSAAAGSILFSFLGNKRAEIVFEPDRTMATTGIDIGELVPKKAPARKKSKKAIAGTTGRYLRDEQIRRDEREYRIAINATLRQAALRSAKEGAASTTSPAALEEDFRKKKLFSPLKDLIVFVVDTSGSMGSGERIPMKAAKGAALAILRKAHPNRGEVAIVAFGGKNAAVVLPPTTSVTIAEAALEQLPAGGATPFAESLLQAWQLVRSERLKNPDVRPVLVIVSDGEANVPLTKGAEPMEELESLAKRIALDRIPALFIDAASPKTGEGGMQKIAEAMQASFVKASELSAAFLFQKVVNLERDA